MKAKLKLCECCQLPNCECFGVSETKEEMEAYKMKTQTEAKHTPEMWINGLNFEEATAIRDQRLFEIESEGIEPIYGDRIHKRWKGSQVPDRNIGPSSEVRS